MITPPSDLQTRANLRFWLLCDYTCDLVYLLDLVLVKPRLTFMRDGITVVIFWLIGPFGQCSPLPPPNRKIPRKCSAITFTAGCSSWICWPFAPWT